MYAHLYLYLMLHTQEASEAVWIICMHYYTAFTTFRCRRFGAESFRRWHRSVQRLYGAAKTFSSQLNIPLDFRLSLFLFHGWDPCNSVSSNWGVSPPDPPCLLDIPIDFRLSLFLFHGWDSCNSVSSYWGVNSPDPPCSLNIPIDFCLSIFLFHGWYSCNRVSAYWGVNSQNPHAH